MNVMRLGFIALVARRVRSRRRPGYPNRPVDLVVADPPGGAPDQLARLLAEKLSAGLGQQVVVDNRAGAGGVLGAEAPPSRARRLHAAHDHDRDLRHPAQPAQEPAVRSGQGLRADLAHRDRVQRPGRQQRVAREERRRARQAREGEARRAQLRFAGIGTPAHLAGEMLNLLADIKVAHVPYKGAAPALLDVIAGQRAIHHHLADRRRRAHERRPGARDRDDRRRAQPEPARPADDRGSGARLRDHADVGHRRAGGHAARRRQAAEREIVKVMNLPDVKERVLRTGAVPVGDAPARSRLTWRRSAKGSAMSSPEAESC